MRSDRENLAYRLFASIFLFAFIGLIWMRYAAITETMNEYTKCTENCIDWRLPVYDASILGFCIGLIGLAHMTHQRLRPILAAIGCLLVSTYTVDLFVYILLHQRLNLQDVIRYAGQVNMNMIEGRPRRKERRVMKEGRALGLPVNLKKREINDLCVDNIMRKEV